MAVVRPLTNFPALEIRKRYSTPIGIGEIINGFSQIGDENPMAGVYQKRARSTGQIFVKMKYVIPFDNKTPAQLARRQIMRNAVIAWQGLTSNDKHAYNSLKHPQRMTGFNRFIGKYLKGEI